MEWKGLIRHRKILRGNYTISFPVPAFVFALSLFAQILHLSHSLCFPILSDAMSRRTLRTQIGAPQARADESWPVLGHGCHFIPLQDMRQLLVFSAAIQPSSDNLARRCSN
uniref:Uncharacterized protein n=1 Tax=Oryza punctata TaxID=4537 RepID=A0A0E0MLS8_ORYPU